MSKLFLVKRYDIYCFGSIVGIFDNVELANKLVREAKPGKEFEIEEYTLNPYKQDLENNKFIFDVSMTKDGRPTYCLVSDEAYEKDRSVLNFNFNRYNNNLSGHIIARTKEEAIEKANKRRLEMIEQGLI